MARRVHRCHRCDRRVRRAAGWNVVLEAGLIVGLLCPACQSPEEDAEAVINEATVVYGSLPDGRVIGRPRGCDDV